MDSQINKAPWPIYIALIHYPIVDKLGRIVTTSVTNFDIHDLARTSKTFDIKSVFFVTPNPKQQNMVKTICEYWHEGKGAVYNPDRKDAIELVKPSESLEETCLTIQKTDGIRPALLATTAKKWPQAVSYDVVRRDWIQRAKRPLLLAFGTGHGLAESFFSACDGILEPIGGRGSYNHLPVRSAVAIILDRLLS